MVMGMTVDNVGFLLGFDQFGKGSTGRGGDHWGGESMRPVSTLVGRSSEVASGRSGMSLRRILFAVSCCSLNLLVRSEEEIPDCTCVVGSRNCQQEAARKAVGDALQFMRKNQCRQKCRRDLACRDAFFVVQQHMDGCPAGTLMSDLERERYEYDLYCHHCWATPPRNESLTDCPLVDCTNGSIVEAWSRLKANCESIAEGGCRATQQCKEDWISVYAAMYMCEPFDVHSVIRKGFHEWQRAFCSSGNGCNAPSPFGEVDCNSDVNLRFQDHSEWTEPDCACVLGPLDCNTRKPVLEALRHLRENDCSSSCRYNLSCQEAFFRLEQYVDGCSADVVDADIAREKHIYDTTCEHCWQQKEMVDLQDDCPPVNCNDRKQLEDAWSSLQTCAGVCTTDMRCRNDFQLLVTAKAVCDHTQVPHIASRGMHNWEEGPCFGALCNVQISRELDCIAGINRKYAGIFPLSTSSQTPSVASRGGASGVAMAGLVLACIACSTWIVSAIFLLHRNMRQRKELQVLEVLELPENSLVSRT